MNTLKIKGHPIIFFCTLKLIKFDFGDVLRLSGSRIRLNIIIYPVYLYYQVSYTMYYADMITPSYHPFTPCHPPPLPLPPAVSYQKCG
jgi:hypothetical protein